MLTKHKPHAHKAHSWLTHSTESLRRAGCYGTPLWNEPQL